ncbi:MAG: aminoacyl-tRNA hydrolase [Candidatus Dasytiphilus stammeri]
MNDLINNNNIKLIVGLSNPGEKYAFSRHNVGSWYVRILANQYNHTLIQKKIFYSHITKIVIANRNIWLLIPDTFMNMNGISVAAMANYYKISPEEILVAHDELQFAPGIAKFKLCGGHGGHNGIKNIINQLGQNKNFKRLRIGIGVPNNRNEINSFVLDKPSKKEQILIKNAIYKSIYCTVILLQEGMIKAMNLLHTL